MSLSKLLTKLALRTSLFLPALTGCGILEAANKQNLIPVSGIVNASILEEVLNKFDSEIRDDLRTTPIYECSCIDTASAHIGNPLNPFDFDPYITVSNYWDSFQIELENQYNSENNIKGPELDDPIFNYEFKSELIAHELLHIAQDKYNIDVLNFYGKIREWYLNPETGIPSANGIYQGNFNGTNRMKLILWWNLYGKKGNPENDDLWKDMNYPARYINSANGVEEFAYIGANVIDSDEEWRMRDRLLELNSEIIEFYRGVIKNEILDLAN